MTAQHAASPVSAGTASSNLHPPGARRCTTPLRYPPPAMGCKRHAIARVCRQRRAALRLQRGVTLVEMMLAMSIGLVLTLGAVQIFVSSKQAYRANDALARIQENGRYALNFLKRDIRAAGFWGCAEDVEVNNVVVGTDVDFDASATIGVENGAGQPDSITLRMANRNSGVNVVQQMPKVSANLFLSSTDDVQEGDIMIVTDCESADIFMVTNNNNLNDNLAHNSGVVVAATENSTQKMSKSYGTDAIAFSAVQREYEVVNGMLQRSTNGRPAEELVDDIADLQLRYGVDSDNNEVPNAYLTAGQIDGSATYSWDEVMSIRIRLLARSREDGIVESPMTQLWDFDGDGNLDPAPDRRLYQQFTATVGVRNRLR